MEEELKIMFSSDQAAKRVYGISGWVDSNDKFWGEEEFGARWAGCTHDVCIDCGAIVRKEHARCNDCANSIYAAKYLKMATREWDGECPLYAEAKDYYFEDKYELANYLEEFPCKLEDLRLMICEPVYFRSIPESFWEEDLQEHCDELPEELAIALGSFNAFIYDLPAFSWQPSKYAVDRRSLSAKLKA